jgi:hypothetical protein
VTAHTAFPADGYSTSWATWDGEHTEHLSLRWENEAWTASGSVGREQVEYVIRLSPLWRLRQFLLFRDLDEPDLWLGTDGRGRWGELNGAHRPELDGATDIVLPITPFTHSLPIRRLALRVGDAAELSVIEIDVETLGTVPKLVIYERTAERTWTITDDQATVMFEVDQYGLPCDIDNNFRRR